ATSIQSQCTGRENRGKSTTTEIPRRFSAGGALEHPRSSTAMLTSMSSSRRHRAERDRSDRSSGGGDGGGGRGRGGGRSRNSGGGRLRRFVLVLAVALAWTRPNSLLAEAACAGGLEGIASDDGTICCLQACGQCGGSGCSDIEGTEETDCCTADISSAGVVCGDNGAVAPCIVQPTPSPTMAPSTAPQIGGTAQPSAPTSTGTVPPATAQPTPLNATSERCPPHLSTGPDPRTGVRPLSLGREKSAVPLLLSSRWIGCPRGSFTLCFPSVPASTCDNGYPGWQTQEACCSDFCGQCGGSGCGTLGSADCCVDNVMAAELVCGVDVFEAPCIVPVLGEGETYAPVVGGTEAPSPPAAGDDIDSTGTPGMAPTSPPVGTLAPAGTSPLVRGGVSVVDQIGCGESSAAAEVVVEALPVPVGSQTISQPAPPVRLCAEGIAGFAHDVVCCPVACGQCGGSGCENIEGTAGASDCCSDVILTSGQTCDATGGVSPCIL
ncbi:unnamed protein product, partial [Scytosiphon promiscuus]